MIIIYIQQAKKVFEIENKAISEVANNLDVNFDKAVDLILKCQGKIIITGIGKSGLVGRKIAATLASTGTSSFFLHPAEGMHGDLGMITKNDLVIMISKSGETAEILHLLPSIKRIGASIIAISSKKNSTLAKNSKLFLNINVSQEACPLGLAPTSSTTATLVLGDALAMVLLKAKNFKAEDFAIFHPGGILGRKLLLKVADLMHIEIENPVIKKDNLVKEALFQITAKKLGTVNVIDDEGKLIGIITDGDLRRNLTKDELILSKKVAQIMTTNPYTITKNKLAAEALKVMQDHNISVLPVIENSKLIGTIHLHDLLKAGIV